MNHFIIAYAFIDEEFFPLSTGLVHAYTSDGRVVESCDVTKGTPAPKDGIAVALSLRWNRFDPAVPASFTNGHGSVTGIMIALPMPRQLYAGETCTPAFEAAMLTNHFAEMRA